MMKINKGSGFHFLIRKIIKIDNTISMGLPFSKTQSWQLFPYRLEYLPADGYTLSDCHEDRTCETFLVKTVVKDEEGNSVDLCFQRSDGLVQNSPWLTRLVPCDIGDQYQHYFYHKGQLIGRGVDSPKYRYAANPPIPKDVINYLNSTYFSSFAHPPSEVPSWWAVKTIPPFFFSKLFLVFLTHRLADLDSPKIYQCTC